MAAARGATAAKRDPLFLGVDLGTSAVKAGIFDAHLREVASFEAPLETDSGAVGRSEQDFDLVLARCRSLLARCQSLPAKGVRRGIVAIGVCTHRSSLVAFDAARDRFASPLVLWNDRRAAELAERLARTPFAARARRIAGLPMLPYFFAPRAAWLRREGIAGREVRFFTPDAALLQAWCRDATTDASMSARTLLADRRGAFDDRLCRGFGIPRRALARVAPTIGARGVLCGGHVPRALHGVPVLAALADQSAAYAGLAGGRDDATTLTIGTGLFAVRGGAASDPQDGVFPLVLRDDGEVVVRGAEANDPSTGSSFEVLTRLLGLPIDPVALDALARRGRPGLRIVPSVTGLGAPWLAPAAHGAILDLSPSTTKADVARGLQDGIAARAAELLALLGGRDDVLAGGGGAKSDFLLQAIADRSGRRVVRVMTSSAGCRGAAALAAAAAGLRAIDAPGRDRSRLASFAPRTSASERHALADGFRTAERIVAEASGR